MDDLIKILRSIWTTTSISLLCMSVNCINAQKAITRDTIIEIKSIAFDAKKAQNTDSLFNVLRDEAWSLKKDSLYEILTFQQIENKKGSAGVFLITSLLEDLMIKEYEFIKKHPKRLLLCYLNISNFYLSQYNTSKASIGLSKYYFDRYYEILKTIPLEDNAVQFHQKHRLRYLEKTHNDSIFYYLNSYELPKQTKNLILTRWYRSKNNYKKELVHAKKSEDTHEL